MSGYGRQADVIFWRITIWILIGAILWTTKFFVASSFMSCATIICICSERVIAIKIMTLKSGYSGTAGYDTVPV
ncbi:hypothetical protein A3783_11510 [Exiguobacterium undae]|uniref:Uncharacterized protein n=1 Tax=Exiguobacterium undae TaxID=169177 RepID=A0ABX2V7M4_9BACL|nr:hypothetical protein A3783_11510 [Exiguobacterium undae]